MARILGKVVNVVSAYALRTTQSRMAVRKSGYSAKTLYRSPRFGYTVKGPGSWETSGTGSSGFDPDTDAVTLSWRGTRDAEVGILAAARCNVLDTAETVRYWTSEKYLSEHMDTETVVVLSERTRKGGGAVLVSPGDADGGPVVTVKEAFDLGRDISVRVTLTADIETLPEIYRSVGQSLSIDGQNVVSLFSMDVLKAVLS